ncbi:hypothetical protein [Halobaculum magnesiiphilum]|uniref:Uncharacterized protein n=1 Tax=Halobaculum magnesiiphilum TaxID=1017351 RepID=A0A8T8WE51_9EURY|nr:hypothetical protein [Halobaculum magnesiiphilum]QZP38130.1 hypothetical protein K6T50_02915 [Halobaculum magnesiiphilum]
MRPKGKLFALLTIFAAIGLVTASGAFTTVQADRTANVEVSGDSSALIGITENESTSLANLNTDDGEATFEFGNSSHGLNQNATTSLTPIADITNNGDEDVELTISFSDLPENWGVTAVDGGNNTISETTTLTPGESIAFGLVFDIPSQSITESEGFSFTIEINADSSEA